MLISSCLMGTLICKCSMSGMTNLVCIVKVVENIQGPEFGVEQKSGPEVNQSPVETDVRTLEPDEMPGSMDDRKAVQTLPCQDIVVETDTKPEMQTELDASSGVNPNPVETTTSQDTGTAIGTYGNPEITDPGVTYRCKRCRALVATEEYVVTHKVGLGEKCFATRKRFHVDEKEPECSCLFVQPMMWMQPVVEGYISGKIPCRKCNARLGQFHWAGMQCSCGAWVNPAFQLVKSKIDECLNASVS
ncbi:hypothetical protein GUJ93_ZPchr0006g45369 [Zizania palustris]|uniref:Uncharacterized protein n=1 Tax=Zizania palustris TaxID=103762 RepID=A0A8J5SEB6_ZIZPA|nr:hypothetical protein GUJ93_ZPchr0006g45369 [Zizania palustris]